MHEIIPDKNAQENCTLHIYIDGQTHHSVMKVTAAMHPTPAAMHNAW